MTDASSKENLKLENYVRVTNVTYSHHDDVHDHHEGTHTWACHTIPSVSAKQVISDDIYWPVGNEPEIAWRAIIATVVWKV
jgi:hypothetical protein